MARLLRPSTSTGFAWHKGQHGERYGRLGPDELLARRVGKVDIKRVVGWRLIEEYTRVESNLRSLRHHRFDVLYPMQDTYSNYTSGCFTLSSQSLQTAQLQRSEKKYRKPADKP